MVEELELQSENTKSIIFGTKNGMIFCVDKRRTSTTYLGTENVRGVHVKNVDVRKTDAVVLIEYEETGEVMERLVMEQSDGTRFDIRGKELQEHRLSNSTHSNVVTYSFLVTLPKKPQTVTLFVNAYNSHGLKTSTSVAFSVHSNFYQNIPTIIILPFLVFCLSILYLLSDYWNLDVSKEAFTEHAL